MERFERSSFKFKIEETNNVVVEGSDQGGYGAATRDGMEEVIKEERLADGQFP